MFHSRKAFTSGVGGVTHTWRTCVSRFTSAAGWWELTIHLEWQVPATLFGGGTGVRNLLGGSSFTRSCVKRTQKALPGAHARHRPQSKPCSSAPE